MDGRRLENWSQFMASRPMHLLPWKMVHSVMHKPNPVSPEAPRNLRCSLLVQSLNSFPTHLSVLMSVPPYNLVIIMKSYLFIISL